MRSIRMRGKTCARARTTEALFDRRSTTTLTMMSRRTWTTTTRRTTTTTKTTKTKSASTNDVDVGSWLRCDAIVVVLAVVLQQDSEWWE